VLTVTAVQRLFERMRASARPEPAAVDGGHPSAGPAKEPAPFSAATAPAGTRTDISSGTKAPSTNAPGTRDDSTSDDSTSDDSTSADSTSADSGEPVADDAEGPLADDRPQPTVPAGEGSVRSVRRVEVPYGLDVAASWSWRLIVIAALIAILVRILSYFAEVFLPIAIAILITALVIPAVDQLQRWGLPRGLATGIMVVFVLAFVGGALALVGQQLASGFGGLATQVTHGIAEIERWLRNGPLHLSQHQLSAALNKLRDAVTSGNQAMVGRVAEFSTAVTHIAAGFFLVLFSTYFFLYEGWRIWGFLVRFVPRSARRQVDGAGRASWVSLTAFVRATVIVALVDAVAITVIALILRVPLAVPIGVLVFLGAFVPIIGATVSGSVAVLVALVAHGPLAAVFMLLGLIFVNQLEAHVLQPFLLGRAVRLHPLSVLFGIAAGVLAAGIGGALVAVPLVATMNSAVRYLSGNTPDTEAPVSVQ
jgi:predicted PurR-regulated permease PerM